MSYETPAQAAKAIRNALKAEMGITSKQVSVRSSSFSMGSAIRLTIKDLTVDFKRVKEIAKEKEEVSRDQATGEILSGGNQHILLSLDSGAVASEAKELAPKLEDLDQGNVNKVRWQGCEIFSLKDCGPCGSKWCVSLPGSGCDLTRIPSVDSYRASETIIRCLVMG